jgi:hypothetical protein
MMRRPPLAKAFLYWFQDFLKMIKLVSFCVRPRWELHRVVPHDLGRSDLVRVSTPLATIA